MIDRICKVSCEEGKNGNEDKEVCSFKLSCVLVYGFGDLWDGKYGISLSARCDAYFIKCMRMGTDNRSPCRI